MRSETRGKHRRCVSLPQGKFKTFFEGNGGKGHDWVFLFAFVLADPVLERSRVQRDR